MRVEYWRPEEAYKDFSYIAKERVLKAAHVIKDATVRKLRSQIGTGKTTGISRPMYETGKYAGVAWTKRDFGELLESVRVVQRKETYGHEVWAKQNVRVYTGNYLAYYASIFEFSKPFMRPAVAETLNRVKDILGTR